MAYDNFPLEIIKQKRRLAPFYRKRQCWFTFYHDIFLKACRFDEQGNVIEYLPCPPPA